MYSSLRIAFKYLQYYFIASNGKGHGVHSPFVFEFVANVLNDNRNFYCYAGIEKLRRELLRDKTVLQVEDFGAGSTVAKSNYRRVCNIARSALKPAKFGKLIFRMANHYNANTIVELGTSLGITTSYLASGNLKGTVYTCEGAKLVAQIAKRNFAELCLENIKLIEGNFDETLQPLLNKLDVVDFAFIDGNHRKDPTIKYFNQLLEKSNENSIFIFDDIHWSKGMEEAWKYIQRYPTVTLTIDLFFLGLVFFKKEHKVRQHFVVRF